MVSLELEARLDNLLFTAQAETANVDLFAPLAESEECPICMIPLPIKYIDIQFYSCCGKDVCNGCIYKHVTTDKANGVSEVDEFKCAFCCQPPPKNNVKALKKLMKKNIPNAFMAMAEHYEQGDDVVQSDTRAIEMYIRAAELGHVDAFGKLGNYYQKGVGVEQDGFKGLQYCQISAKKGSIQAHKALAQEHETRGNVDEAVRHATVAASAGDQESMDNLMNAYKDESLSKEELTETLRAYQASSNAMKSKDRDDYRLFEEMHPM